MLFSLVLLLSLVLVLVLALMLLTLMMLMRCWCWCWLLLLLLSLAAALTPPRRSPSYELRNPKLAELGLQAAFLATDQTSSLAASGPAPAGAPAAAARPPSSTRLLKVRVLASLPPGRPGWSGPSPVSTH